MTITLKKSGESIEASDVVVSSKTEIKGSGTYDAAATFDLKPGGTPAATGFWDVEVTNPDGQSATGTNFFHISAPAEVANEDEIAGANGLDYNDLKFSNERHLVRDSAGNWYAVFGDGTIYITRSTDGVNWDAPTALAGSGGIILSTSTYPMDKGVSVDIYRPGPVSNDRLHVVWSYVYGSGSSWTGYVCYSRCNDLANYNIAESWSQVDGETSPRYDTIEKTSTCTFCNAGFPDIAVDSQGYLHVAWYTHDNSYGYVRYRQNRTTGLDWYPNIETDPDPLDPGIEIASETESNYGSLYYSYPSIDTDRNNYVHVSWSQAYTPPNPDINVIRYERSTDWTSFTDKTDIITDNNNMGAPSLVVHTEKIDESYYNKIYVVCSESTDNDLWWAYYDGTDPYDVSHWSKNNNLTNGAIDIDSPVVGAKMGEKVTDHILLAKVGAGTSSFDKVIFWMWNGTDDWALETDPDTGNDSTLYFSIEKHSPGTSPTMGYLFYDNDGDKIYFDEVMGLSQATVVELSLFSARGDGSKVRVEWETKTEIDNLGFNLYRSTERHGSYTKLNKELIRGLLSSVRGKQYTYLDEDVTKGTVYYYVLEDIDLDGTRTMHGPICVDWDADGVADDTDTNPLTAGSGGGSQPGIPVGSSNVLTPGSSGWSTMGQAGGKGTVQVGRFRASGQDGGVALEWQTDSELDNVGFHLYRELDGQVYRVTPNLVPGSVFKVGVGTALPGAQSYTFWDALSARTGRELYWLEYIDVYGQRGYYGPIKLDVYGQWIPERVAKRYNALAQLQRAKTEAFWDAQALRGWLSTRGIKGAKRPVAFRPLTPKESSPPLAGQVQWDLAAQAAVKILITEKGWYRVLQPDLVAAGLDPGVDPRYLQLYVDGEQQPMTVTGSADGRFDAEDAVEFYATGLDTPWTDTRVYWLVAGSAPGRRMELWKERGGREPASSFPYEVELKERTIYFAALKNGDAENFFGALVASTPVDQLVRVHSVDPEAPSEALLEVTLQGVTDAPHQVSVLFNDAEAGEVVFAGQIRGVVAVPIPHDWLLEGNNIVTLAAQGGSMDVNLVDSIRLTYWRTYNAEEDLLRCTAAGDEQLTIGGFTSENIRVMDITDPASVQELVAAVKGQGSGYSATVRVPGYGIHTLLAFTDGGIKQPALIMDNLPSAWHDTDQGADMVIIAHGDLLADIEPLKQLRQQQGLSVAVIDVEDLYDEFSFGAKTPYAIKDFLARAYINWDPQPRFVLLVGDASSDPRNYLGFGDLDLVPTKQVETKYLETASDDWFVDLDGDLLAEMAIGRLPVGSPEECAAVVAKLIGYEEVAGSLGEVLLVADENDEYFDFEAAAYEVAGLIPDQLEVLGIFRGEVGSSLARSQLLATIDQGPLLVNYMGHGSAGIWRGSILTSADAASFTNYPSLPFFVNMTCLNGVFHDVYSESLGEALLRAQQGGAVAVWASSGLTLPEGQLIMNKELMRLLFNGEGLTIGEAVRGAKEAVSDDDIRQTWNLLGDPTTRIW